MENPFAKYLQSQNEEDFVEVELPAAPVAVSEDNPFAKFLQEEAEGDFIEYPVDQSGNIPDPTLSRSDIPSFEDAPQGNVPQEPTPQKEPTVWDNIQYWNPFSSQSPNAQKNMNEEFSNEFRRFVEPLPISQPGRNLVAGAAGGLANTPANLASTGLAIADIGAEKMGYDTNMAEWFDETVPRWTPREDSPMEKLGTVGGEISLGAVGGAKTAGNLLRRGMSRRTAVPAGVVAGEAIMASSLSPDTKPAFVGSEAELLRILPGFETGPDQDYSTNRLKNVGNLATEGTLMSGAIGAGAYAGRNLVGVLSDLVKPIARLMFTNSRQAMAADPIIDALLSRHPGLAGDPKATAQWIDKAADEFGVLKVGDQVVVRDAVSALELALEKEMLENPKIDHSGLINELRGIRQTMVGIDGGSLKAALDAPNKALDTNIAQSRAALGGDEAMDVARDEVATQAQRIVGEARVPLEEAALREQELLQTGDEFIQNNPIFARNTGGKVDLSVATEPAEKVLDIAESVTKNFEEKRAAFRQELDKVSPNSKVRNVKEFRAVVQDVLDDPNIPETIKTSLLDSGVGFKNLYEKSVPEINQWIAAANASNPVEYMSQIDKLRNVTTYVSNNPPKGPGERAANFYKEELAPIINDGTSGDLYKEYRQTIGRSNRGGEVYAPRTQTEGAIGAENYRKASAKMIERELHDPYATQVTKIMAERGESDKIVDYAIGSIAKQLMGPSLGAGRRAGEALDNTSTAGLVSAIQRIMPSLEQSSPAKVAELRDLISNIENAKGDISLVRDQIAQYAKEADAVEADVYRHTFKEFFEKDGSVVPNSYEAFRRLFRDPQSGNRIDRIAREINNSSNQAAKDGLKSAYLKNLSDIMYSSAGRMSQRAWREVSEELKPILKNGDRIYGDDKDAFEVVKALINESGRMLESRGSAPLMTTTTNLASEAQSSIGSIIAFSLGVLNRAAARARIASKTVIGRINPDMSFRVLRDEMFADASKLAEIIKKHPINKGEIPLPVKRYIANLIAKTSTLTLPEIQTYMAEEEGTGEKEGSKAVEEDYSNITITSPGSILDVSEEEYMNNPDL